MTEVDLKKVITKGYIQLAMQQIDQSTGEVIKEEKGGFVEDWENGTLWVLLDVEKTSMIDADFNLNKLIKRNKLD
jgi:hypothetical protein